MREPPSLDVRCKHATITSSDTSSTKIFSLPADVYILAIRCVTSATATGGSLNVGTVSDPDHFVDAYDVSSAQSNVCTLLNAYSALTTVTDIYADIDYSGSAAGGPFRIEVIYTSKAYTFR